MMIAYCGLDCTMCDAFIATARNDNELRAKIAKEWAKAYNAPILPEHINCTGCRSDGVKVYYCEQMCEIRKCARAMNIETCAECQDYSCDKLNNFFAMAPHAKDALESLRQR